MYIETAAEMETLCQFFQVKLSYLVILEQYVQFILEQLQQPSLKAKINLYCHSYSNQKMQVHKQ